MKSWRIIKSSSMTLKDILQIALLFVLLEKTIGAEIENDPRKDPINYYTTMELACSDGYPVQEHKVVTDDGYVLTVHRIPKGRIRPKVPHNKNQYHKIHLHHHPDFNDCVRESLNESSSGLPLLLVPGVLMSSDGWLLQGPGYDLAYMLADSGYDVWMANVRGSFYCKKHKWLSPSDPEFWDFSFHENAYYDMPATIDYILKLTKKDKIGYVGLSMGTTIFFAMTSLRPEYNEKILGFVGLAPVAYIKEIHMNARRKILFGFLEGVFRELRKRDLQEIFPRHTGFVNFGRNYCIKGSTLQDFCYDLTSLVMGYHSKLVLRNKFHLYTTHIPTGTSMKTFYHYLQNINGNSFKLFDYGAVNNTKMYGTATAPDYPLWKITAPVALYYTEGDFYYDSKDINDLRRLLPNVVDVDVKHKFNHGDYLWSYKAKDLVYNRVLALLKSLTDQYYLQNRKKKSISTQN